MSTSSFSKNININNKKKAKKLIKALNKAGKIEKSKKVLHPHVYKLNKNEIKDLFGKKREEIIKIKGLEKISKEQQELMDQVNQKHIKSVGSEHKKGMQIQKVWLDENNCICVLLKNGEWYHYTNEMRWF